MQIILNGVTVSGMPDVESVRIIPPCAVLGLMPDAIEFSEETDTVTMKYHGRKLTMKDFGFIDEKPAAEDTGAEPKSILPAIAIVPRLCHAIHQIKTGHKANGMYELQEIIDLIDGKTPLVEMDENGLPH